MKSNLITVVLILIVAGMGLFFLNAWRGSHSLTGPGFLVNKSVAQSPNPSPTSTPPPSRIPKTFNFDRSTDLKAELDKVNPQVLDSDFE